MKFLIHPPTGCPRNRYLRKVITTITLLAIGLSFILTILINLIANNPSLLQGIVLAIIITVILVPLIAFRYYDILFKLENSKKKIKELSRTDDLTGLINRRHFFELAEIQLALAERHQYPVSILHIDLNQLKLINEQYGHQTGDQVLQRTAHVLQRTVRGTDILARYGSEEFILLMPHTSGESAITLCERMQRGLKETQKKQELPIVTMRTGASCTDPHGIHLEELLIAAEKALAIAKDRSQETCVLA